MVAPMGNPALHVWTGAGAGVTAGRPCQCYGQYAAPALGFVLLTPVYDALG
jgi:hypothetical protein